MQPNRHYTMYIDASYVINGMNSRSNHYSQGTNGDLWTLTYTELDRLGSPGVKCVKVKSHVTDGREWTIYNMTARGLVLNELADGAVEEGTGRISRSTEAIAKDGEQCFTAKRIALRLAAIESSIWKAQDERKQYQGSDFSKLYRKQAESIKRKLEDAVESTNGINGHSVYEYAGWIKCRDCPCRARPSNPDYWPLHACSKLRKKPKTESTGGRLELIKGYEQFLLHAPLEEYELSSGGSDGEAAADPKPSLFCSLCSTGEDECDVHRCTGCDLTACVVCEQYHQCGRCFMQVCLSCYCRHECSSDPPTPHVFTHLTGDRVSGKMPFLSGPDRGWTHAANSGRAESELRESDSTN
jgi:hypothetical protein